MNELQSKSLKELVLSAQISDKPQIVSYVESVSSDITGTIETVSSDITGTIEIISSFLSTYIDEKVKPLSGREYFLSNDIYTLFNDVIEALGGKINLPPLPTLTKVHPSDEPQTLGYMKPNPYENTVEGTNLAAATKLEFKYMDGEDEYVDEFEIVSKTADGIVFKANPDTLQDIGGHLIVTTPAGICEGDFMATVMGS